jgi:hypothetical protein
MELQMCDPRLLVGGRPDVARRVANQPIATWMWGGMNMQEALFHFASLARMAGGSGLRTEPVALHVRCLFWSLPACFLHVASLSR